MKSRILEHLGAPDYQPVKPIVLAKQLHIPKQELREFREAVEELLSAGRLQQGRNGLLRLRAARGLIAGTIKRTSGGFGFLIPEGRTSEKGQDIYIARDDMRDAQTGDQVLVEIVAKSKSGDGRTRGRIVEVLERATNTYVGRYFEREGRGFVQVDGTTFQEPVFVGDPGAKGVQPDDKVVIEMVRFPTHTRSGEAVLTQVLGARGEPGVDTLSIIHEFGLPDAFPPQVLEEARVAAQQFDEENLGDRLDLTGEIIVTIDPVDARDFDDAISLERTPEGNWRLGVHIADVAHFLPPGSALDVEAQKRGTSVYLPDRVLPMLPEILSNSLASLQQGRVRFTKSVFMEYTAEGTFLHAEFANSAIRVTRRFAYEQVLPIVEGRVSVPREIEDLLQRMHELAMILRARRFEAGALELTMPEVKIDFDKQGKVSGAHLSPHDESHQIIEEFMLAANIAVATALSDQKTPFLRRVHGDPDEAKLRAFAEFVRSLGIPLKKFQSRHALQKLLDSVKGQPLMHSVNYALLRSMKQAEYSSEEEAGHYALAVDNYCHFTSPIRRYPDLTVHRLIGRMVEGQRARRKASKSAKRTADIIALGRHCSSTERRAAEAERELIKVKLLAYMAERIGEELEAMITGVKDYGFYCQGVEIPAEGLVHVSTLADDFYYYEDYAHRLVGRRSGKEYRLGQRVRVEVARVDVDRRELDFRLVGSPRPKGPPPPRPEQPRSRKRDRHPEPAKHHGKKPKPGKRGKGKRR
jgi:ribonuclease R